jgi:HlyD family secretion protein
MRKRAAAALFFVLLLGLGGGWFWWQRAPAPLGDSITLYGDVDIREMQPAFNDSGPVTALLVEEGQQVRRGELLATLDASRAAATLAQAKAQRAAAAEQLAKLLAGSRPEEIAQAKATMDALEATARNNETLWHRYAALATTSAASIQQRDNALAAFESARQQYEAARQAWLLAVKGPRQEDIAAASAQLAAATAAEALAQRQFDDTRLYAPASGVIEDRILEVGDMASPATPVFTIALPSPLWVRVYVPETLLGRVHLGEAAVITTDSAPGTLYHGWVGYLSPTAEFTPKTVETPELRTALVYQARVYVCDPHGGLRLGMPATVTLEPGHATAPPGCGAVDAVKP